MKLSEYIMKLLKVMQESGDIEVFSSDTLGDSATIYVKPGNPSIKDIRPYDHTTQKLDERRSAVII